METTNPQTNHTQDHTQTKNTQDHTKKLFFPPQQEDFITEPTDFKQVLPASLIHTLEIDLLGGNLIVIGDSENEITITMQWDKRNPQLLPKVEQKGSVLFIQSQSIRPFLGQQNRYIIEIHTPRKTRVRANLSFGNCYFAHLEDYTEAYVKFGDVQGFLKNGKVEITAGDIKIHGISGDIDAHVDAGNIELVFEQIPSTTKAFCAVGDIALKFPEGTNPKANLSRGFLKKYNIENQAQASITATLGIGDLTTC